MGIGYAVALVITVVLAAPVVWISWWALASIGENHSYYGPRLAH